MSRLGALALSIFVVVAACTSSETAPTADSRPSAPTTLGVTATTETFGATSTTQPPVTTTEPSETPPRIFEYAVVAEEQARRLAIIDPATACSNDDGACAPAPIVSIDLPERPHNLAGVGSVVYATHPSAGSISRVDLATGDILTTTVGTEPHDIEPSTTSGELLVADEGGRRLLTLDSETLEIIGQVELPAEPHNLAVGETGVWVTMIGSRDLARVHGNQVDLFPTGGSPHDLIVDRGGLIWFSNWGSDTLSTYDPSAGSTTEAPAGVTQPHHFAIAPDGAVWVSDNGGGAIVGFGTQTVTLEVGPVPHHIGFVGDTLVVAVSGAGQAVFVEDGRIVGTSQLSVGLHGVAVTRVPAPLESA